MASACRPCSPVPASVDLGGHLERVLAREDGPLEEAAGVDEQLARAGVLTSVRGPVGMPYYEISWASACC